jgi:hypothetical protein
VEDTIEIPLKKCGSYGHWLQFLKFVEAIIEISK